MKSLFPLMTSVDGEKLGPAIKTLYFIPCFVSVCHFPDWIHLSTQFLLTLEEVEWRTELKKSTPATVYDSSQTFRIFKQCKGQWWTATIKWSLILWAPSSCLFYGESDRDAGRVALLPLSADDGSLLWYSAVLLLLSRWWWRARRKWD